LDRQARALTRPSEVPLSSLGELTGHEVQVGVDPAELRPLPQVVPA